MTMRGRELFPAVPDEAVAALEKAVEQLMGELEELCRTGRAADADELAAMVVAKFTIEMARL